MPKITDPERETQSRILSFFQDELKYVSYGDLRHQVNSNIKTDVLSHVLVTRRGYDPHVAALAIQKLEAAASNLQHGLYAANEEVYGLLKYGAKVKPSPGEAEKTVFFVNWEHPLENEFAIAEEVTIRDKSERRPDLVVYINGVAVAVLELKKATISVSNGIRQNITNQDDRFNKAFFTTVQFLMAGNTSEGLRYGAIETPEKYYLEWKNDSSTETQPLDEVSLGILGRCAGFAGKLEKSVYSMFHKRRLLDLIHNFVVFDRGIKKVCRYNQFFGVKKAQVRLSKGEGGIIWHTQGSGKTLTMVWLSKWILANSPEARVLIATDRDELDEQVKETYLGVGEQVHQARSGKDLVERLGKTEKRLICSLVHKFGRRGGEASDLDYDKFIEELRKSLPVGFSAKGDFVVFVDECHRTQSGKLHRAMKAILPNAVFIGFTGTPLLKKDRATSIETFGWYIHTYKYHEGVADGAVLDLRYEARDIDQVITAVDRIDEYFEAKTRVLNDVAKAKLKAKWGSMQELYSSGNRLQVIVSDIMHDFETKARLMNGRGNAMLVAGSIYEACKYYDRFQFSAFRECAIITSFDPAGGGASGEVEGSKEFEVRDIYKKMVGDSSVEEFEAEAKRKFVKEPSKMKLLIVVDKLLTGFDAPPCTYLYIDKSMQDHGLFQAICRVNRLDGEDKEFGYIVDYKQLFGSLKDALAKFTSDVFKDYDPEDIKGMIGDRLSAAKKYLDAALEELDGLCGGVPAPREQIDYTRYFCGLDVVGGADAEVYSRSREKLYKLVNRLIRAYAEIKGDMGEAGYTDIEQANIDKEVAHYAALKEVIGRDSGDFIDLKCYEPDMRHLIDTYIKAEDSCKIGGFDDFTLMSFVAAQGERLKEEGRGREAAAEAIENNVRKKIVERIIINPKYYEKMSTILDELIIARRKEADDYERFLEKYLELVGNVETPEDNLRYPESVRHSEARRAFYDNCGEDEALAVALDEAVRESREEGFRHNKPKRRRIKKALSDILQADGEVERVYELVAAQTEY